MLIMDDKTLNSLDGDSTYQEVEREILVNTITKNRKKYKDAMKTSILNRDSAKESVDRATIILNDCQNKLNALIDGGMEGYLSNNKEDDTTEPLPKKRYIGENYNAFNTFSRKVWL
jgi:hypothetical protein